MYFLKKTERCVVNFEARKSKKAKIGGSPTFRVAVVSETTSKEVSKMT